MAMASDGKKFSGRQAMLSHERKMSKPAPQAETSDDESGSYGMDEGGEDPMAHGPASEVHITHDHEGGMHHVHAVHADGTESHSDHGSVEEAHEHGKKLAMGHGEPDGDEMGGACA